MKEKIKKILLPILPLSILFLFIVLPFSNAEARQGCCSWHGGVCGCQCCDGTSLSSTCLPYYPECLGGETYDYPSYDYTPSIPDCPFNSYYDSISDSCKCYSGYIVSGEKCILASQWCQNEYGLWATYDHSTDSCKCMSGYIFGKDFLGNTTCISADQYCKNKYGYNARYNTLNDNCECGYGYILEGGKCISENDYCHDLYGFNAEYDSSTDKCVCKKGYVVDSTKTRCIDGDTHCRDKYGIHSNYDYWDEKCECDSGYVFFNNKCVDVDNYCQNLYGSHSSYDSLTKLCECDYGYKLKGSQCVAPEVSKIFPLEVEISEEITITGQHFGNSKYSDLKIYIGFTKVNTLDISKWTDDKILFKVGDYLESGYVYLKGDEVNVRSSYLEILEPAPEKEGGFVYTPSPQKTDDKEKESQPTEESEIQSDLEFSPPEEFQTESESLAKEIETPESQEEDAERHEEPKKSEEKKEQKNPVWIFLANSLNAIKNFFGSLF